MKIEPVANGNLRIWLAEDEIEEWGLSETDSDGVRRLVRRALTAAGRRPGTRVEAEMIPVEGGCVLLVSPCIHKRSQPVVYAAEADALVEMYHRLPPDTMAQVYAVGEEYRVVLYGEVAETVLREYGYPIGYGEGAVAHTAEYGEWLFTMPAPAPPVGEDPTQ